MVERVVGASGEAGQVGRSSSGRTCASKRKRRFTRPPPIRPSKIRPIEIRLIEIRPIATLFFSHIFFGQKHFGHSRYHHQMQDKLRRLFIQFFLPIAFCLLVLLFVYTTYKVSGKKNMVSFQNRLQERSFNHVVLLSLCLRVCISGHTHIPYWR